MRRLMLPLLGLCAVAGAAAAQDPPGPPNLLVINREEIKPGKLAPHEKTAASFVSVVSRTPAQSYRLALVPVTGDDNVVVYLEGHDSWAALETARRQFDEAVRSNAALKAELDQLDRQGDVHASQQTAIYRYRPNLSYRPQGMDQVARARFLGITRIRVQPGRGPDYADYLKTINAAREKAGSDMHTAVYQAVSGDPNGTFLVVGLNRSLAERDEAAIRAEANQKAIDAALGGDEAAKKLRIFFSELVIDSTHSLFELRPALSRPSETFAAYDPEFWKPVKAPSVKALAIGKDVRKQ